MSGKPLFTAHVISRTWTAEQIWTVGQGDITLPERESPRERFRKECKDSRIYRFTSQMLCVRVRTLYH